MAATEPRPDVPWSTILADARAALAAGQTMNRERLAGRIRAVASSAQVDQALAQLDRVFAVERARARLAREPMRIPAPQPATRPLRSALRTRPTLTANMDVRRQIDGASYWLEWDADGRVLEWEIRIAERADARSDYVTVDERTLGAAETTIALPVTERALRVHVLGRARGGKLLRRAVITGLSSESWDERWQRRGSAA